MRLLQLQGFTITRITGWRAYLGTAQHNYPHWTRVTLPEGRPDMAQLESTPGVLPFEVYSQAPLRLISWCSFELPKAAKRLLRELAIMCEVPEDYNTGTSQPYCHPKPTGTHGARCNPIFGLIGNSQHCVQGQIAHV